MKNLTRILLAAVAASFVMAPMANAQPRHDDRRPAPHFVQKKPHGFDRKAPAYKGHARHHWSKGERVTDWKRRAPVRDYHRHGLRKPPRGQQWIKVDNDYLLISIASGVIAGIIAGR
jgi:Predicted integral membrane protein